jgi:hypothetical protein
MLKPTARRSMRPLNDFQVFKGQSETTMQAFGGPVMAHHEACLMVRDDQRSSKTAMYAIYRRSENRILQIMHSNAEADALPLAA